MSSLTIRNVPEGVLAALRAAARGNRRSLNSEVVERLERSAAGWGPAEGELLARIAARRERLRVPFLEDEQLERIIDQGRE